MPKITKLPAKKTSVKTKKVTPSIIKAKKVTTTIQKPSKTIKKGLPALIVLGLNELLIFSVT